VWIWQRPTLSVQHISKTAQVLAVFDFINNLFAAVSLYYNKTAQHRFSQKLSKMPFLCCFSKTKTTNETEFFCI